MTPERRRAAVLFDRDGTINLPPKDYVIDPQDFVPVPGVFEALARLSRAGLGVAICTNQSCIHKGIVPEKTVDAIHEKCHGLAEAAGGRVDGIYVCPHRPEEDCFCRKPRPGLLLDAMRIHHFDPARTYFVGDSLRDLAAARAARITPVFVRTGNDASLSSNEVGARSFATAVEAVDWILELEIGREGDPR